MTEWETYKRQAKEAEQASQRAQGVLQQLKTELEATWGCTTAKESKAKLAELKQEKEAAQAAAAAALKDFEAKWKAYQRGTQSDD